MPITESELKALHQLVTQDEALLTRVHSAPTALDVARIIAQAGCAHGLSVTIEALLPHIQDATLQPPETSLSEAQLADVAGGATYTIKIEHKPPPSHYFYFLQPPGSARGHEQLIHDWMLRR